MNGDRIKQNNVEGINKINKASSFYELDLGILYNSPKDNDSPCDSCLELRENLVCFKQYIGNPSVHIFILYNKYSGGDIEKYFVPELEEIVLKIDGIFAYVHFVNMIDEIERGINQLENILKVTTKDICLLVVGGDGSLSTAIDIFIRRLSNEHIERLLFSLLPFGTGNDWARTFGWYSYINMNFVKDDLYPLIYLIKGVLTSEIVEFDVWKVNIDLLESNGTNDSCFLKVNSLSQELEVMKNQDSINITRFDRYWINYFSFGEESKVGILFDKNRKKNVLINKAIYGITGSFFSVSKKKNETEMLSQVLKDVTILDSEDNTEVCAFCIEGGLHASKDNICPTLTNSISLLFLNIELFGGGVEVWKNSKSLGPSFKKTDQIGDFMDFKPSYNDGKLEIMSFSGLSDIGTIFLPYMSTAKRVGQFISTNNQNDSDIFLQNDFLLSNSKNEDNSKILQLNKYLKANRVLKLRFNSSYVDSSENIELYFQVDGEFYIARGPKESSVKLGRKIKVLKCVLPYNPFVI